MVTPFVAGSLELMTPGLTSVPGRPRLFVHGDAAASFAVHSRRREGRRPRRFRASRRLRAFADREGGHHRGAGQHDDRGGEAPAALRRRGRRVHARARGSAGCGSSPPSSTCGRRSRSPASSTGPLRSWTHPTAGGVSRRLPPDRAERRREADLPRHRPRPRGRAGHAARGPLRAEPSTSRSQAYAFLGDLEVEFSDTNEDGESANWSFEKNRWGFRGGVGLRFRWLPE